MRQMDPRDYIDEAERNIFIPGRIQSTIGLVSVNNNWRINSVLSEPDTINNRRQINQLEGIHQPETIDIVSWRRKFVNSFMNLFERQSQSQQISINTRNVDYFGQAIGRGVRGPSHTNDFHHVFSESPELIGPFCFNKSISVDIKPNPTYEELFNVMNEYPLTYFNFNIISQHKAYGNGSSKQIYTCVMDNIIDKLLSIQGYFLDISMDNLKFWNFEDNIELFVSYIGLYITSGCILPYHFHPILLQKITGKPMTQTQQMEFLKYYSPDIYVKINKDNFDVALTTGYDTIEEYITTDFFMRDIPEWKLNLYDKIAKYFVKKFPTICDYSCTDLDILISGYYELKSSDVVKIMSIDNELYQKMWICFIDSLTQNQLKKLLLLCGNTLCIKSKFNITVCDYLKTDIHITTCCLQVSLNQKLFESDETLSQLKIYLDEVDQTIVDMYNWPDCVYGRVRFYPDGYNPLSVEVGSSPQGYNYNSEQQLTNTEYSRANEYIRRDMMAQFDIYDRDGFLDNRRIPRNNSGQFVRYNRTDIHVPQILTPSFEERYTLWRSELPSHIPLPKNYNSFVIYLNNAFKFDILIPIRIGYLFQNDLSHTTNKSMFCYYKNCNKNNIKLNSLEKFISKLMSKFLQNNLIICVNTELLSDLVQKFFTPMIKNSKLIY